MIYVVKRFKTWNIGDVKSNPMDYFLLDRTKINLEIEELENFNFFNKEQDWLIVGGGGLWCHVIPKWIKLLQEALNTFGKRVIFWGLGENYFNNNSIFPPLKTIQGRLIGIREPINEKEEYIEHVPCASCMDPLFEDFRKNKIQNKRGFYLYYGNRHCPSGIIDPICKNNKRFEDVLTFLSSCEYVYTNCYHGAYWSLLLNKKCLLFGCSTYKGFVPPITYLRKPKSVEDLYATEIIDPNSRYLEECRFINLEFAKKVRRVVEANC